MTMQDKLATYVARESALREARVALFEAENDLLAAMQAEGAEVLDEAEYGIRVEVTREVNYDQNVLDQLREYLPPDRVPTYQTPEKVIPARWNATKVKPLARRSAVLRAIIEAARIEGPPRLRVRIPKAE